MTITRKLGRTGTSAAAIVSAFGFDFDHAFGFYSKLTGRYRGARDRETYEYEAAWHPSGTVILWDAKVPGKKRDAIDTDQITPAADCVSESLETLDEKWKAGSFRYLMPDFRARVHRGDRRAVWSKRRRGLQHRHRSAVLRRRRALPRQVFGAMT